MTTQIADETAGVFPLHRPATLALAARFGARRYRRGRDLPGAVPGLLAGAPAAIIPRLFTEEARCEEARLAQSATYRPARHVQILSALLAEAAAAERRSKARTAPAAAPVDRREPARMFAARQAAGRPPRPARRAQTNASGSEFLRLAM